MLFSNKHFFFHAQIINNSTNLELVYVSKFIWKKNTCNKNENVIIYFDDEVNMYFRENQVSKVLKVKRVYLAVMELR